MIDAQRGDAASRRAGNHIGCVKPPAKAHLDHAGVRRVPRESQKAGRRGHFEEAGGQVFAGIQHFGEQAGQFFVGNQLAGDADALVIAHQMRLGRRVDREALGFQHGAQVGAGRSFAVGAGNVEGRRQAGLRIAEPGEHRGDGFEAKAALRQGERGEPVKLRLDRRIVRSGEVSHAR